MNCRRNHDEGDELGDATTIGTDCRRAYNCALRPPVAALAAVEPGEDPHHLPPPKQQDLPSSSLLVSTFQAERVNRWVSSPPEGHGHPNIPLTALDLPSIQP